jgi:predicted DNA-binding transcriptional regulator YafY
MLKVSAVAERKGSAIEAAAATNSRTAVMRRRVVGFTGEKAGTQQVRWVLPARLSPH